MGGLVQTHLRDLGIIKPPKRLVYISDLHFDRAAPDMKALTGKEANAGAALLCRQIEYEEDDSFLDQEAAFIQFVREHFANDILFLAGDYYTDYRRTLAFIRRLEDARVESYFVLGNHDFSSNDQIGLDRIISLFEAATSSHQYCRFLNTGKKYYYEDICIIGDTGWNLSCPIGPESIRHFSGSLLERQSKRWIKFASGVLAQEKKVLMVTHFPQAVSSQQNMPWRCFDWENSKLLFNTEHGWQIFGHTHQRGAFQFHNNICAQRGYKRKTAKSRYRLRPGWNSDLSDFGILEREVTRSADEPFHEILAFHHLSPYYSTALVQDLEKEPEAVKEITSRGFKRTGHADNKRAIAALLSDKQAYLDCVKEGLNGVERSEYMGYVLAKSVPESVVNAVNASIDILENGDPRNVKPFMTAVVITGYVYNGCIQFLQQMRPLDDYDIMRWYLLFATIQKYDLEPMEIATVRKNSKEQIYFQNVPISLPKVNDQSLTTIEALALLGEIGLLGEGRGMLPDQ